MRWIRKNNYRKITIYSAFAFFLCVSFIFTGRLFNENSKSDKFAVISDKIRDETYLNDQKKLLKLLSLCHNGDEFGEAYMITKEFYISGNTEDIYINTCYPIEISTSQSGRSMGHCSDFLLFVYYADARLSPQYNQETYQKHVKNCPQTTYIHGEFPIDVLFELRQRNLWMPNVEQVDKRQEYLIGKTTLFLAKTMKSYRVLKSYLINHDLNIPITLSSHSSPDPMFQNNINVEQNFNTFYHGNGHSGLKSTRELIKCWERNPDLPTLTVVGNNQQVVADNIQYFSDLSISEVRKLQKMNGIHICPSVREGFGHYINEARGMGALVLTTDFGPMNEFVDDRSGLRVKHEGVIHESHQLFDNVQVKITPENICGAVKALLEIPYELRETMGMNGREEFERDYFKMVESKRRTKTDAFQYFYQQVLTDNQIERLFADLNLKTQELTEKSKWNKILF